MAEAVTKDAARSVRGGPPRTVGMPRPNSLDSQEHCPPTLYVRLRLCPAQLMINPYAREALWPCLGSAPSSPASPLVPPAHRRQIPTRLGTAAQRSTRRLVDIPPLSLTHQLLSRPRPSHQTFLFPLSARQTPPHTHHAPPHRIVRGHLWCFPIRPPRLAAGPALRPLPVSRRPRPRHQAQDWSPHPPRRPIRRRSLLGVWPRSNRLWMHWLPGKISRGPPRSEGHPGHCPLQR